MIKSLKEAFWSKTEIKTVEDVKTIGDLRKLILSVQGKKRWEQTKGQAGDAVKDAAAQEILGKIPGALAAKTMFDFIKASYDLPDEARTGAALDYLDVDDNISKIVDDPIENAFIKALSKKLEAMDGNVPIEDLNMTKMLGDYMKKEFDNRTVTGFDEGINHLMMNREEKRKLLEMAGLCRKSDLLLKEAEEDDDEGAEDTEADLFAEEEPEDDTGESGDTDEEEGEEEIEDTGEEVEEKEIEPVEKLTSKEISELGPSEVEQEITGVIDQAFNDSIKSSRIKYQNESKLYRNSLVSLLLESDDSEVDPEEFDMEHFASETARYIENYTTLLDIEGMLFNKAKDMLLQRFGSKGREVVDRFEDHMADIHGIDLTGKYSDAIPSNYAVGASGGDGGSL